MYSIPGVADDVNSPLNNITGGIKSNSPNSGIGYTGGAGGIVTQLTSVTTSVTLNAMCGIVNTFAGQSLVAGTTYSFEIKNSFVASNDLIISNPSGYSNTGSGQGSWYATVLNPGSIWIGFTPDLGGVFPSLKFTFAIIKLPDTASLVKF